MSDYRCDSCYRFPCNCPDVPRCKHEQEELTAEDECRALVLDFFRGDEQKARLWWTTDNPLLGNIAPYDLLYLRPSKILDFIKVQLEGNLR